MKSLGNRKLIQCIDKNILTFAFTKQISSFPRDVKFKKENAQLKKHFNWASMIYSGVNSLSLNQK